MISNCETCLNHRQVKTVLANTLLCQYDAIRAQNDIRASAHAYINKLKKRSDNKETSVAHELSSLRERCIAQIEEIKTEEGLEECPICADSAPDVLTSCGHIMCKTCFVKSTVMNSCGPPRCPVCRTHAPKPYRVSGVRQTAQTTLPPDIFGSKFVAVVNVLSQISEQKQRSLIIVGTSNIKKVVVLLAHVGFKPRSLLRPTKRSGNRITSDNVRAIDDFCKDKTGILVASDETIFGLRIPRHTSNVLLLGGAHNASSTATVRRLEQSCVACCVSDLRAPRRTVKLHHFISAGTVEDETWTKTHPEAFL